MPLDQPSPHESVQATYDAVAEDYANRFRDELEEKPLDRALLAALLEGTGPNPTIADIGCGPGHVAGWMGQRGAAVVAIDLSPEMVKIAERDNKGVAGRVGDFLALPASEGEFGAVVAFYSLIHLAPEELPLALGEVWRVLREGGLFLVAFHAGTGTIHRDDWFGHTVDVDFHFLEPTEVTSALESAGFTVSAHLQRAAYPEETPTLRSYILAARSALPADDAG